MRQSSQTTDARGEAPADMATEPRPKLLLIVCGSSLRAEEMDRPLAYYFKQQVERHLAESPPEGLRLFVRVVADFRWLNDDPLQRMPTISLGGPGVNALARRWVEDGLPVSLAADGRYFVQMDPDLAEPRASVWGMDNATTQIAVSSFLSRFLPRFLDRCADDDVPGLELAEPDPGPESDPDLDEDDESDDPDPDD